MELKFDRLVALLGAFLVLSGCEKQPVAEEGANLVDERGIVQVGADDQAMNDAMQEARETLDVFLDAFDKKSEDEFGGVLKVYFTDNGVDDGEHMWVELTEVDEDRENFSGILMSQPGSLKSVKMGDQVNFDPAQISDWMLIENGKAKGAYTIQVLRKRMSDRERAEHDAAYPFSYD